MKFTEKTNCCSHCKRENNKCLKKKQVLKHFLGDKINASLLKKTKTVPNAYGLYCITSNDAGEVLYIGFSNRSVRQRLLAHTGGYDKQAIGRFLKGKDLRKFSLSWVKERKAECLEQQFIEYVTHDQGFRPLFNLKRGRSCGKKEE
ncbi:uncharacterized protein LOC134695236 isoform X2 [Mytilus trossulus]|uniref:uncharacterized protein LOC134695236 isoform X2 n=1 Tax=Mytilus trossulus TaxID=6551 RepID=UPI003004EAD0